MSLEKGTKVNKLSLAQQVEIGNYLTDNESTVTDIDKCAEDLGDYLGFKITPTNLLAVCKVFKIEVKQTPRKQLNWNVKIMRALVRVVIAHVRNQTIPKDAFEELLEYEHRIGANEDDS